MRKYFFTLSFVLIFFSAKAQTVATYSDEQLLLNYKKEKTDPTVLKTTYQLKLGPQSITIEEANRLDALLMQHKNILFSKTSAETKSIELVVKKETRIEDIKNILVSKGLEINAYAEK